MIRAALAQRLGRPGKPSVVYRLLERHGWRKVAPDTSPKSNPAAQEDWKKLPETLAALLTPEEVRGRRVRLMFQDEARFGRMVRMRRCWSPAPHRPSVSNGYEREFVYVTAPSARSRGDMDWMISQKMNAEQMTLFLSQVSAAHPEDFIVMVLDGASSHKAKIFGGPTTSGSSPCPSMPLNSTPRSIYGMSFEKEFPNRVFDDLAAVIRPLQQGLPRLSADRERLRSLTAWPWIVSLILTAN